MKRFSTVALGVAVLMAASSVLAVDGTPVARRTTRQDILSGRAQTSPSNAAPIVADRAEQAVLDQGLVPVQPILPPEIDVLGVVYTTRSGLFLEGVEANLELRQTDVRPTIRLDRVQLDVNEMAEAMAAKTVTARPIVDRPILAGN